MRRGVAILSALIGGGFLVSGCGGISSVTFEVGEAYCFAYGEDFDSSDKITCNYPSYVFLARTADSLDVLQVLERDVKLETQYSLSGRNLLNDGESIGRIRTVTGGFRIIDPEDDDDEMKLWLIPAKTHAARQLKRLNAELTELESNGGLPAEDSKYLNTPLCQNITWFRDGRLNNEHDQCEDYGIATIFASGGYVVTLPVSSVEDDDAIIFDVESKWSEVNGVPRPDMFSNYEWVEHEQGALVTKPLREEKEYRLGSGQAFDPSVIESVRAFTLYDGADKDDLAKAFAQKVYPILRKEQLLKEHFPEFAE